jgi:hypothetical protein
MRKRGFALGALMLMEGLGGCGEKSRAASLMAADAPPASCTFSAAAQQSDRCGNVLPDTWTNDSATTLLKVSGNLHWSNERPAILRASRRPKFESNECGRPRYRGPMALLRAPKEIYPDPDTSKWVDGTMAIVARYVITQDNCRDRYYNAGKTIRRNAADEVEVIPLRRDYFLVLKYEKSKVAGDLRIGTWFLIGIDKDGKHTEVRTTGAYHACEQKHPDITQVRTAFRTCHVAHEVFAIAARLGVRPDAAMEAFDALSYRKSIMDAGFDTTGTWNREPANRTLALSLVLPPIPPINAAALDSLRALSHLSNPGEDPAWMNCILGCCVADDPVDPGGDGPAPASRSNESASLQRKRAPSARSLAAPGS